MLRKHDLKMIPLAHTPTESSVIKFVVKNKSPGPILRFRTLIFAILTVSLAFQIWYCINIDIFDASLVKNRVLIGQVVLWALMCLKQEPEEQMIIMKNIGVQLVSIKEWRFQAPGRSFIPLTSMIDLVIHEGFHGYGQVIFYLCILLKPKYGTAKEESLVKVVFPTFLPNKEILLKVWGLSRELMFGNIQRYIGTKGINRQPQKVETSEHELFCLKKKSKV